jgi:hypothetical protein
MTPIKSTLSREFLLAMVGAMYRYEAHDVRDPALLTDAEMLDFYAAYMGVSA